jgi:bifunctional non-homologous end joining protein LigD
MSEVVRAGRRRIEISHPEKVLFPDAGITKLDLARHYERVAGVMVPHVKGHPVAMHVFPDGVDAGGFFVKDAPAHFPEWIPRAELAKRGGTVTHVLASDAATLVYLANQNCITPHIWLSRADRPDHPDRLIFDLDPSRQRFAEVRAAARAFGDLLRDLGLPPFAMTTGSRGLHVLVPLRRTAPFDEVRRFGRLAARTLADRHPRRLTTEQRKAKRGERIFIDVNRNAYAQHAVAPYAARPRSNAPVATPLRWEELDDRRLRPDGWTIRTIDDRLASEGDAWRGLSRQRATLGRALRQLEAEG